MLNLGNRRIVEHCDIATEFHSENISLYLDIIGVRSENKCLVCARIVSSMDNVIIVTAALIRTCFVFQ